MAVGDVSFPKMHSIAGLTIGSSEAYVRYANRRDMVIFEIAEGASVAGVFTQSAFAAAPVILCKKHLLENSIRYLIINTGNANAATGQVGLENAQKTCEKLAELSGVQPNQILPFSTGVIGEQLPIERMLQGVQPALNSLNADSWEDAAYGIMTTDTTPKGASEQFELDGVTYSMTGISKGAGMIRPNMATMLSFVATDAPISQVLVQKLLSTTVEQSFNRITVDGDTSTNDSCIFIATGQAGGAQIQSETDSRYQVVLEVLSRIMLRLAQLIIRDGEGATKFITVKVEGGSETQECCDVAYSIAESPLIKTALFAADPNWGRIVMAIGKAGVPNLDSSKVQVWLDDVQICLDGGANPDYREEMGAAVMQQQEITIRVDLGRGIAQDTVYTCDFSYDYVKINADYRS
ncbi:bifunctional glutamate N-acetyltransferase/amino-acid acetyltransferase ArgJ [Acinetobacter sp. A3.8]|uniref:Arginine biosynthesis bifunctional protein ArgJ n=1 Tax=Acinetobacter sedimenti TaxID=2919922 RepID=A0A9X2B7B4_9GAMM|nr:bifunctional glutamate N-acetyltransferase/amino-acid acetyltransferase ArgJ [Acinetobacter sedimenti]MCJ8146932.1 bifunctional glutamate N-acetyltransferase/amino-acid acetyltransferase ArgJ [Acinetobacter sedimenti]